MTHRNERLADAIAEAGLTLARLAKAAGVHVKSVERWVYENRMPRRDTALRSARVLGADADWLWPRTLRRRTRKWIRR